MISTAILFCLFATVSNSCTTFFINKDGQMVFGRNYDWITGNGMVCTNLRGLYKTSFKASDGKSISWTSKYGSITFNQYGKEFPTGGMNEKGLVVELMWLDGTAYPNEDDRPAMGVLQWIQYQLDNCSTIEELIATDQKIRISAKGTTPLHYLVADANGNAATIEFFNGKMTVHTGKDLPYPVLTNSTYESSIEKTRESSQAAGVFDVQFADNSIDRFSKACNRVIVYQKQKIATPIIDYSFNILNTVAQGSHTKWSIVYDLVNKKVYFKTLDYPTIKNISFDSFKWECSASAKSWNMNQAGAGDIASYFSDFTIDVNTELVNKSFDESASEFTVDPDRRKLQFNYPTSVICKPTRN
jgi:penicillin V acylase-like amidase (Ntn superfamily)